MELKKKRKGSLLPNQTTRRIFFLANFENQNILSHCVQRANKLIFLILSNRKTHSQTIHLKNIRASNFSFFSLLKIVRSGGLRKLSLSKLKMMMERNRRLLFPSFLLLLFAFMVTSLRAQSLPGFLGDPSRFNSKAFKELFFQNMNGAAEEELFLPNCPHYPIPRNVDPQNLPSQIEEAIQQANSSINSFLERKNIAGPIHVSVSINQEVVWEQGYGLTTKKVSQSSTTTPTTPSSTSVFRIGSLTKLFTAMLMLGMRDAGYISSLDDPVQKYEPLFSPKNPFPTSSNITFRQLASHLGGLGREAPCLDLFHSKQDLCFYNSSTIYSRYSSQRLIYPPDTLPSYSNMGFSVIGNALGTILLANQVNLTLDPSCLDVSYEETCMFESAVTKFLFEPLGFECTSFRSPESGVVGGTTGNIVTPQYEAGWTCPAGQIYSCNEDLSKLLSFLMRDDKPVDVNGGQPLDGATIREFLLPRFTNNDGRTGFGTPWENFHMPVNEIAQPLPLEKRASPSAPQGIWVNTKTGMVCI